MDAITYIAEARIREAQEQGAFDNLPGTGQPIDLSAEADIPPEFRMAYTLLKNGGYISSGRKISSCPAVRSALPAAESEIYSTVLRLELSKELKARKG